MVQDSTLFRPHSVTHGGWRIFDSQLVRAFKRFPVGILLPASIRPREGLFLLSGLWDRYEAGIVNTCPTCMRVCFKPGFAAIKTSSLIPYFFAMADGVSPA